MWGTPKSCGFPFPTKTTSSKQQHRMQRSTDRLIGWGWEDSQAENDQFTPLIDDIHHVAGPLFLSR
jgi:hypothetical protein